MQLYFVAYLALYPGRAGCGCMLAANLFHLIFGESQKDAPALNCSSRYRLVSETETQRALVERTTMTLRIPILRSVNSVKAKLSYCNSGHANTTGGPQDT